MKVLITLRVRVHRTLALGVLARGIVVQVCWASIQLLGTWTLKVKDDAEIFLRHTQIGVRNASGS